MSMAADITSLELIAAVHRIEEVEHIFQRVVHTLHKQVTHFEWIGIYLHQDHTFVLKAAAGDPFPSSISRKAILQIPFIGSNGDQMGKITVTSREAVAFDESDFTSLETLAREISVKLEKRR